MAQMPTHDIASGVWRQAANMGISSRPLVYPAVFVATTALHPPATGTESQQLPDSFAFKDATAFATIAVTWESICFWSTTLSGIYCITYDQHFLGTNICS
ncbi:hypothetical protein ABBQ32_001087 [Trebouxia sp. C0010 RCD-2024]